MAGKDVSKAAKATPSASIKRKANGGEASPGAKKVIVKGKDSKGDTKDKKRPASADGGKGKGSDDKSKDKGKGGDFKKRKSSDDGAGSKGKGKPFGNNSSSSGKAGSKAFEKLDPVAKRQKIQQDRKESKPNYNLLDEMKKVWNAVREKSTPDATRNAAVNRMAERVRGHAVAIAMKHDGSRIIQFILQYTSGKEFKGMFEELSSGILQMSTSPYGHFVVLKMLPRCEGEVAQKKMAASLRGKFSSLATSSFGAQVAETMLQTFPVDATKALKSELYISKAATAATAMSFDQALPTLQAALDATPTEKRALVMEGVHKLLLKMLEKDNMLEFSYVHHLLFEFVSAASAIGGSVSEEQLTGLMETLSSDLRRFITTRQGAFAACILIAHASSKDRKKMIKGLKGNVLESLLHESGHLAIVRLVELTDDTVTIQKELLKEILEAPKEQKFSAGGVEIDQQHPLKLIATSRHGSKLLLRLLAPLKSDHLQKDEIEIFEQVSKTSKKDPSLRRQEHLRYLQSELLSVCSASYNELITCNNGSRVLSEVTKVFNSTEMNALLGPALLSAMDTASKAWTETKNPKVLAQSIPVFIRDIFDFEAKRANGDEIDDQFWNEKANKSGADAAAAATTSTSRAKPKRGRSGSDASTSDPAPASSPSSSVQSSLCAHLEQTSYDWAVWAIYNPALSLLGRMVQVPAVNRVLKKQLKAKSVAAALSERAKGNKAAQQVLASIK